MSFLVPTLDNADPLFAPVITPRFYLHNVELVDQALVIFLLYACIFGVTKYSLLYRTQLFTAVFFNAYVQDWFLSKVM